MNVAILVSGKGSLLRSLYQDFQSNKISGNLSLVISSDPPREAIDFCKSVDLPYAIALSNNAIFTTCRNQKIDLVVCAGFLKLLDVPEDYKNKVINIHPSLNQLFLARVSTD